MHMISEAVGTWDVYTVYVYSLISGGQGMASGRLAKNGVGLGKMALVGLMGLRGGNFLNAGDGLGLRSGDSFALKAVGVGGEGGGDTAEVFVGELVDAVSKLVSDPFPSGGVVQGGSMILAVVEMSSA